MKTPIIFVASTSLTRGPQRLAIQKASLFCSNAKGVFLPISGGLPLPNAKKRTARASGLVDSGIRQAAFLSAYVNKSHHAHRNQVPRRPADLPRTPDNTGKKPATRPRNGAAITAAAPGVYRKETPHFGAVKSGLISCFSVT